MTFRNALAGIRKTIEQHGDKLDNEEITKHVLILPMLEGGVTTTAIPPRCGRSIR